MAYGIEETKDVVRLAAKVGMAVYHAGKDGKWSWMDYIHFLPVLPHFGVAVENIDLVPMELGDLDSEELEELLEMARNEFDIGEGDLKEFVENCSDIGILVIRNIQIGSNWWK